MNGLRQFRDYDPAPILQALQLIVTAYANRPAGGGVMVGKNKFFQPSTTERPFSLGGGLEAWRGFYASVRPVHKQLMVNLNICTTAFYRPGNLAERLNEFMDASFGARADGFVYGIKVKTTHLGHTKSVRGLAKHTAKTYKFDAGEGLGEVSVEQYFKRSEYLWQRPVFHL